MSEIRIGPYTDPYRLVARRVGQIMNKVADDMIKDHLKDIRDAKKAGDQKKVDQLTKDGSGPITK